MKHLLTRIRGIASKSFEPAYLYLSHFFAKRELRWINRQGIGETDFHDLLRLYPKLQRILYIHIPKCGGTSIRRSLVRENMCAPVPMPDSGSINQSINFMLWSASRKSVQRKFLNSCAAAQGSENLPQKYLRVFTAYRVAQSPKRMFILGHQQASELITYFREDRDLLFATVRAPAEILKSLVAYRVSHTLEDHLRADSIKLLDSLKLSIELFTELVRTQPQRLTELILERPKPALNVYLAFDHRTDHESVWKGIRDRSVFLSHMSEQDPMIAKLLGNQPGKHIENTSADRQGMAAEFTFALQKSWIEPFVDRESMMLYQKLEDLGIIGFWKSGGTVPEYIELLKKS